MLKYGGFRPCSTTLFWPYSHLLQPQLYPLCDIPSGCSFFTGPWTVTRSSLCVLRRVNAV